MRSQSGVKIAWGVAEGFPRGKLIDQKPRETAGLPEQEAVVGRYRRHSPSPLPVRASVLARSYDDLSYS